jgi:1-acyl-sn-glycerol-3-phosphate acyltransferase
VLDNVPVDCLLEEGADFIIASNVVPAPLPLPPDAQDNALQRALSRWSPLRRVRDGMRAFYLQARQLGDRSGVADVQFKPDLSAFPVPDYAMADEIIARASREVGPVLAQARDRYRALGKARPRETHREPIELAEPVRTNPVPRRLRRPEVRADGPPSPILRGYLGALKLSSRYFRYECDGFEHIARSPPSLIVGYHGRPFAWDMALLSGRIYEELGYFPRAFTAKSVRETPLYREVAAAYGALYDPPDEEEMARIRGAGHHIAVTPGGLREAVRPFWVRYRIDFGGRRGYIRFAREHRLPIIPVVATGIDDAYLGLNDGYRLSHLVMGNGMYSLWLGLGLGGFYPFALPLPVRIRQRIGPPIDLDRFEGGARSEDEIIEQAHAHVVSTMQGMLDALRGKRGG